MKKNMYACMHEKEFGKIITYHKIPVLLEDI